MRFLHTADWHLGKTLARRSRHAEFTDALRQLAELVAAEAVDVLLVAGDIFDTAVPPAESEAQLFEFLLAIESTGTQTVLIAGNHDNPRKLRAVAPLLRRVHVHAVDRPAGPESGGLLELKSRDGRETARVAAIPFVDARHFDADLDARVRAELATLNGTAPDAAKPLSYAARCRGLMALFADEFREDTINILVAHTFIDGVEMAGSERPLENMRLSVADLPPRTDYVALGHIHRAQPVSAPMPVRYSGSLMQLTFGEAGYGKSVTIIDADAGGENLTFRDVPFVAGKQLRDVTGTMDEIAAWGNASEFGDDFLRVTVMGEVPRVGLGDDVRRHLPNAIHVRLQADLPGMNGPNATDAAAMDGLVSRGPRLEQDIVDLYADYYRHAHAAELPPAVADALRRISDDVLREGGGRIPNEPLRDSDAATADNADGDDVGEDAANEAD